MFMNFRRIRKRQCVQSSTTVMVLCVVTVCWEELDHHLVSHMKSYSYRYLINRYDFLNSTSSSSSVGRSGNYPYSINHPNKCRDANGKDLDDVFLLLFVKSSPKNSEHRQAIRETWGNESFVWTESGVNVRLSFAMGVYADVAQRARIQEVSQQEDEAYGDSIQQDFIDTFHNSTTKSIMQFHWNHIYCSQARFLMTADDDIFVHMPNLVRYSQHLSGSQSGAKDLWVGHVHRGAPPVRRKDSKYFVSYDLYPWPSYPDYTAGAGYVVSGDVAAKIYQATSVSNSSSYIDDVFMGICAKAMGVSPQEHVYFSGEGKASYHPCIYAHMITSHGHSADVRSSWRAAVGFPASKNSRGFSGNSYCTAVRVMLSCRPYYQNTYSCAAAFT